MTKLWLLFGITSLLALISLYSLLYPNTEDIKNEEQEIQDREIQYSDLLTCRQPDRAWTESMPLRYLGTHLTSSKGKFLTLCPGDYFGDLNDTYVVMKNCDLEMYHKGQWIWSAIKPRSRRFEVSYPMEDCAGFLAPDGNLILKYGIHSPGKASDVRETYDLWYSETNFMPLKTELKVQGQQFQIFQTFQDGAQKLFYVNGTHPKFIQYLKGSKRVGSSHFIKSHADNDTTLLRTNEYLGDLDGLHLLLQKNCELHLINQTGTIWFFKQPFFMSHPIDCSLVIEEEKWISLANVFYKDQEPSLNSLIILHSFKVLQSEFILKDDQLTILQTLQDGSKRVFESQIGQILPPLQETGLKMRKESRQIAKNRITGNQTSFTIERMDYIGELNGLHLMLQDNCSLTLANGQERLWQLYDRILNPCMECSLQPFSDGSGSDCLHTHRSSKSIHLGLGFLNSNGEIKLENNHAIISVYSERYNSSGVYYAGPNTRGTLFRRISEHSLVLKAQDRKDFHFLDRSYIGDLNGVYLFLNNCNWALYNQSQVLWESGKIWKPEFDTRGDRLNCQMSFKSDGTLATPYRQITGYHPTHYFAYYEDGYLWSINNITKNNDPSKKLETSELSVNDDWLWLINTFTDGTVQKFKALEGTNDFIAV